MNPALMLACLLAVAVDATTEDPAPESTRKPVAPVARPTDWRAQLSSAVAAQVAWGAWESAEAGAKEMVPDVIAAMQRTLAAPIDAATPFVLRAELDALIRLDARLAASDLAAVSSVRSVQAETLVLAARDPKLHAGAIESMRTDSYKEHRIAIDNLLAAGAPARAVALLLPDARVGIAVHVLDEGMSRGLGNSRRGIACGSMKVPDGFPPTALYSLERRPREDDLLLVDGPQPIAYRRVVKTEREIGTSSRSDGFDSAEHALGLLRWIAQDRVKENVLRAHVALDHTWRDARTYFDDILPRIEARREAWRALVQRLMNDKLLEPYRVPAREPIDVTVTDHREDRLVPLPPL